MSFRLGSENPSILKERSRAGAEVDLGGSDLCGRQPAYDPECERDLRLTSQRRTVSPANEEPEEAPLPASAATLWARIMDQAFSYTAPPFPVRSAVAFMGTCTSLLTGPCMCQ